MWKNEVTSTARHKQVVRMYDEDLTVSDRALPQTGQLEYWIASASGSGFHV